MGAGCCAARRATAAAAGARTQGGAAGQDAADPAPALLLGPQLGQGQGPRGHYHGRGGKGEEDKFIAI